MNERLYLRVFSVGDIIALASTLLSIGIGYGVLSGEVKAQGEEIASLKQQVNLPIENARDIAVLKQSSLIAERDRLELKHELIDRMAALEAQNREILSRLPPKR